VLLGLLLGCRPRPPRAPGGFTWAHTPAAGGTSTCPDDAVDLTGDRTPTMDDVRCSYSDAERGTARVDGSVLRDGERGLGKGVEGVEVVLVRLPDPADAADAAPRPFARTRTDAQGSFTLGARVPPGRYELHTAGGASAPWRWEGRGPWARHDLRIFVPPPVP
jgi:hypothetical protein